MTEIARKLGVELPKPIVDAFGQMTFASRKARTAIDTSWLQTRGALERANAATQELTYTTEGLSEKAIMLGHAINVARRGSERLRQRRGQNDRETKALLNLQI